MTKLKRFISFYYKKFITEVDQSSWLIIYLLPLVYKSTIMLEAKIIQQTLSCWVFMKINLSVLYLFKANYSIRSSPCDFKNTTPLLLDLEISTNDNNNSFICAT